MIGLNHFDPSTPEQVSSSVNNLLHDVLYAFLGSAFAIFASIIVTWLEKLSIAKCYKYLENSQLPWTPFMTVVLVRSTLPRW
jgi:heme/copper-type cytochrome/quinol oxidase subunit 3